MAIVCAFAATSAGAQAPQPGPFTVGNPLGLPIDPTVGGSFRPMSSNVKVYGAIFSAESCSYDAVRNLIVVPNRSVGQNVQDNNAWISLINHDGSVHTARWIGLNRNELILNEPLGSDIVNGVLYLADRDGGLRTVVVSGTELQAGPNTPQVSVVRRFDMATGRPMGEVRVETSTGFNDIEVAEDGTIYGTVSGAQGHVYRITPAGESSVFIPTGAPLASPNGVAFDPAGNIVIVNSGDDGVLTYDRTGRLVLTERREHPERRLDVLRLGRESARDPHEREQRARVRAAGRAVGRGSHLEAAEPERASYTYARSATPRPTDAPTP
jgi:outer membrane protein assembly factor BamB